MNPKNKHGLTRRELLGSLIAGAAGLSLGSLGSTGKPLQAAETITPCDPRVRGPFPILSTPFTESGEVDYEVLAKEARFVDWCGSPGMIWPQSGDSVDLLTMDEKLKGMETLAKAVGNKKSALCLGVQGKNTEDMLVYARHAEKLNPTAIISRPPDEGKTDEDMREYWYALAKVAKRPVIIQTSGGTAYRGKSPSTKLLIELAKKFPYFGYVKEEGTPTIPRMKELVAAKPAIKCVMSAWGGFGWLHHSELGIEGLVTERAVYADLLAKIWACMEKGDRVKAADLYSRLLLMLNLKQTVPGNELRGFHLYIWKKRGIFKNMISRAYGPKNSIPKKPIFSEFELTPDVIEELDTRFEVIKPYLRQGEFKG
ncbi:MAG: dihydrodipicolinate synthase family protein [Planctomycetia bacterium]|nr:dihydrodipicolinate synthase family protein [Planctomycetia bacterium]